MNYCKLTIKILLLVMIGLAPFSVYAERALVTPLMKKTLDGVENKEGVMLTVEYAPGASSHSHRHNAHVFVYVLEGSITMQVSGSAPITVEAGNTFYESPKDIHLISKNASDTESAKFIVFSVKEKGVPVVFPLRR